MADQKYNDNEDSKSQSQQILPEEWARNTFIKYKFVYCWIEGNSHIGKKNEFNFKFNLWIRSRDDKITFQMNFKALKHILSYVCQEKIYFAAQKLPQSMYIQHNTFHNFNDYHSNNITQLKCIKHQSIEMKNINNVWILCQI